MRTFEDLARQNHEFGETLNANTFGPQMTQMDADKTTCFRVNPDEHERSREHALDFVVGETGRFAPGRDGECRLLGQHGERRGARDRLVVQEHGDPGRDVGHAPATLSKGWSRPWGGKTCTRPSLWVRRFSRRNRDRGRGKGTERSLEAGPRFVYCSLICSVPISRWETRCTSMQIPYPFRYAYCTSGLLPVASYEQRFTPR